MRRYQVLLEVDGKTLHLDWGSEVLAKEWIWEHVRQSASQNYSMRNHIRIVTFFIEDTEF